MKPFVLASLLVPLAACSSSTPCTAANAGSPITAVSISDFAFSPSCFAVAKGSTVTFTNMGPSLHTATTIDGPESFNSMNIPLDMPFTHTFGMTAGTVNFHCLNHPVMTGTLIVQ
jgi:plastocyanin